MIQGRLLGVCARYPYGIPKERGKKVVRLVPNEIISFARGMKTEDRTAWFNKDLGTLATALYGLAY